MVRELADGDHEQEDAAGREHREDDLLALLGGVSHDDLMKDGAHHGEKLPHVPLGMRRERGVDRLVTRCRTGSRAERRRVRAQTQRGERLAERAPAE